MRVTNFIKETNKNFPNTLHSNTENPKSLQFYHAPYPGYNPKLLTLNKTGKYDPQEATHGTWP